MCVFASERPCNTYTFWQGLNVRQGLPKLEQLAFLFLLSPTKKLTLPVFSRLRSESLHSSSDWLFNSRHRCTHTHAYIHYPPPTHTHTLPQPVGFLAWCGSHAQPLLTWVNPPGLHHHLHGLPSLNSSGLVGDSSPQSNSPLGPPWTSHNSIWARHLRARTGQGRTEERNDGDTTGSST